MYYKRKIIYESKYKFNLFIQFLSVDIIIENVWLPLSFFSHTVYVIYKVFGARINDPILIYPTGPMT